MRFNVGHFTRFLRNEWASRQLFSVHCAFLRCQRTLFGPTSLGQVHNVQALAHLRRTVSSHEQPQAHRTSGIQITKFITCVGVPVHHNDENVRRPLQEGSGELGLGVPEPSLSINSISSIQSPSTYACGRVSMLTNSRAVPNLPSMSCGSTRTTLLTHHTRTAFP